MDYKQILESVGYPTDIICLDFETYFDAEYTLEKMSSIEYINDKRFEFTGLGVGGIHQDTIWTDYIPTESISNYIHKKWGDYTVLVQNARFDITIMQRKFGVVPWYIIDLKDLACHYDSRMSHRLRDLAKLFGLNDKGDTQKFRGLHYYNMTDEYINELAGYTINDVDLELQLFKILLPKLSTPELEIPIMEHTLNMWLHKRFKIDRFKAVDLSMKMTKKIRDAVEKSGHTITELRSQKFAGYVQAALPPGETVPMKQGKNKMIPAFSKTDAECQQLAVHRIEKVRDLVNARLIVKSWPTHVAKIRNIVAQADANGGLLRIPLNYCGCHTGRPSGGEGINLLNLGGKGRGGILVDPLIGAMRGLLVAEPGHILGLCDSAQIEARILAWLAGCSKLLIGFKNKEDIYSEFISPIVGILVRKPRKTDPELVALYLDLLRNLGKDSILGYGYGLGAETQYNKFLSNPKLRPMFDSGKYDFAFVKKTVDKYRSDFKEIPKYWTAVENAFRKCIRFPHLKPEVGPVKFMCEDREVHIVLPSGRILYYQRCYINKFNEICTAHGTLWGGSITENIDQSICRDLLCFWMLRCEEEGLPVMLHVYDELITLLPEDGAEEKIKVQRDIMCSLPAWAGGIPVDAEAKLSKCYCK